MGESPSARTERELGGLRAALGRDIDALTERVREDVDPRNVMRRQPIATVGALGSLALAGAVGVVRKLRSRRRRPEKEIDRIVEGLGGRIDKLKGKARKRFREQLRKEVSEVDKPKRSAQEAMWGVVAAALTAAATTLARGFAARLTADDRAERAATSDADTTAADTTAPQLRDPSRSGDRDQEGGRT